jgi:hypothetical protein
MMKLCQKIILDTDNKLLSNLYPQSVSYKQIESVYERLLGPCDLSFHPFVLEAWCAKTVSFPSDDQALSFELIWDIHIVDDEEHKNLLSRLCHNRSLLLLSETFNGLEEVINIIGFSLNYIRPDPTKNLISLNISLTDTSYKKALGGALILRTALDSLLFVRGLIIDSSTLVSPELEKVLGVVLNMPMRVQK